MRVSVPPLPATAPPARRSAWRAAGIAVSLLALAAAAAIGASPGAAGEDSLPPAAPPAPPPESTQAAPGAGPAMVRISAGRELVPASPHPFGAGESLRFSVQYGFIHAGTAWLEVPDVTDWNGSPCWRLVARAESNSFFDKMYRVRNRIESLWDREGRFSWRYVEDRHEGHYTANDTIIVDTTAHLARYKNGQTSEVPAGAQDALSAFYFTRFQPLPIGGSLWFDYHASHKSTQLEVRVLGRDRVKTPAGRFDCIMIEPILKAGGIFKNNGRLVIWITDDARRMPVMMRSKVMIGSISVVLQDAKTGA